jgi:hypothetical protein
MCYGITCLTDNVVDTQVRYGLAIVERAKNVRGLTQCPGTAPG